MATNVTDKLLGLSPRITLPPHIDPDDFHAVSDYVAPRAIAREVYRHKMAGNRIAVERDGEAVWLEPEEIEVQEALLCDLSDAADARRYRRELLRCSPLRDGMLRRADAAQVKPKPPTNEVKNVPA